jgi:hypothetical protein
MSDFVAAAVDEEGPRARFVQVLLQVAHAVYFVRMLGLLCTVFPASDITPLLLYTQLPKLSSCCV